MSESLRLRVVPKPEEWSESSHDVVIGKDILELLSTSMYVDPMTVYREYLQNAADSIDQARDCGFLRRADGTVKIKVDPGLRTISIRDDGASIPAAEFVERLTNLGSSRKRGTSARGFRGVGRLAGLGYCQELVFRGRAEGDERVSELRWDGRALKSLLRSADHGKNLRALVKDVVSVRQVKSVDEPKRFFEVQMRGVIRHRDDRLLNEAAVSDYLSQVAPIPFSSNFKFAPQITEALGPNVRLGQLAVYINEATEHLCRPFRDEMRIDGRTEATFTNLEIRNLSGMDGGVGAVVWVLHHEYSGALSNRALIKGLRLRSGNIQVGDHTLLEYLFPEARFNSWAVGEVHIVDPRILANGRRDNFEHSVHLDNVLNQLAPMAREISRRCRQSSVSRKWLREFELHREAAFERAKAVARGGLTRISRQAHVDAALKSVKAMKKVVETRHLDDEIRQHLTEEATAAESRVHKLLGQDAAMSDPFGALPASRKAAYQHVISLIYECSANRVAAGALIERLLARLADESAAAVVKARKPPRHPKRRKQTGLRNVKKI